MSSIAYITDYKLLDNHRLNQNKEMNFWRLSTNTRFSAFGEGGLVFFLSKSKEHQNKNREKGIVGFGRLKNIFVGTPRAMWDKFTRKNGYNTYEDFIAAIERASKKGELPKNISSFYLENICFFQNPIYLSECGMEISKNVESFTYITNEASLKILEYGKENSDIWSSSYEQEKKIEEEKIGMWLAIAQEKAGEIKYNSTKQKRIQTTINGFLIENPAYHKIHGSYGNVCNIYEDSVSILMYHDQDTELKQLLGQAMIYKQYLNKAFQSRLIVQIKTLDNDEEFSELIN